MATEAKEKEKKKNSRALNERYIQRITLVKQGKEAVYKKDFIKAMKYYNSYLNLLSDVKDTDVASLGPRHFEPKKDQGEMLLISHIYWEMCKILDHSPNLQTEFNRCLFKFIEFSLNQGYQVVNAEMLRKHIRKDKHVHKREFEEAYKKIYISNTKCYIATLCFGQEHPITSKFRELKAPLFESFWGREFIILYYQYSPKFTHYCEKHKFFSFFATNLFFRPILFILYKLICALR